MTRKLLRFAALFVVVAAFAFWLAAGANRGWTKTSVPVRWTDDVTGIEGIRYESKFLPGLDFLGGALIGAAVLAGASLPVRSKNPQTL